MNLLASIDTAPVGGGFQPQELLDECYSEMRRTARALIANDSAPFMLQATELAHETAIRLLRLDTIRVQDRAHMLALAARVMRQALIDEVRRTLAAKRQPSTITDWPDRRGRRVELDLLDDGLRALLAVSVEHAEIVELRFSLGLSVEETATATGLNPRTVKRRWQAARAWLQAYLNTGETGGDA